MPCLRSVPANPRDICAPGLSLTAGSSLHFSKYRWLGARAVGLEDAMPASVAEAGFNDLAAPPVPLAMGASAGHMRHEIRPGMLVQDVAAFRAFQAGALEPSCPAGPLRKIDAAYRGHARADDPERFESKSRAGFWDISEHAQKGRGTQEDARAKDDAEEGEKTRDVEAPQKTPAPPLGGRPSQGEFLSRHLDVGQAAPSAPWMISMLSLSPLP